MNLKNKALQAFATNQATRYSDTMVTVGQAFEQVFGVTPDLVEPISGRVKCDGLEFHFNGTFYLRMKCERCGMGGFTEVTSLVVLGFLLIHGWPHHSCRE